MAKRKKVNLRAGSREIKKKLLATDPFCDICGTNKGLQLHHVYLIRHGFKSRLEGCVLLCATCHQEFHLRWDKYLDSTFKKNPQADFMALYNILKDL